MSEVEIPEAIKLTEDKNSKHIDVNIKYSHMTKEIESHLANGERYGYNKDEFWFAIDNVAIYRICNGDTIYIEDTGGVASEIKTFLLGSAFGALLIQRNIVAIHGGTILLGDSAITITGDTGAGKSTLTSAFSISGCKFFADDVSALDITKDEEVYIRPAYPQQKLCRDAVIKLGLSFDDLKWIDEDRDKFAVPSHKTFIKEPKKLKYIIEICVDKDNKLNTDIDIEEVKGIQKLQSMMKNVYRVEVIDITGIDKEYFKKVSKIAGKVKYYRITRKKDIFTIDKEMDLIKSQIGV